MESHDIEWIFSGIGVFVIALLVRFVTKRWKKRNSFSRKIFSRQANTIIVNNNSELWETTEAKGRSRRLLKTDNPAKTIIRVLFVDSSPFKVADILKNSGWIYTKQVFDVLDLENPDVLEADVIFVDANKVGVALFKDQGLGLAVNLKMKFNFKKVILYSEETHGDIFHEALRIVDACLYKNEEPYQFIKVLENFAGELLADDLHLL